MYAEICTGRVVAVNGGARTKRGNNQRTFKIPATLHTHPTLTDGPEVSPREDITSRRLHIPASHLTLLAFQSKQSTVALLISSGAAFTVTFVEMHCGTSDGHCQPSFVFVPLPSEILQGASSQIQTPATRSTLAGTAEGNEKQPDGDDAGLVVLQIGQLLRPYDPGAQRRIDRYHRHGYALLSRAR
jgi:hypothetical protein